MKLSSIVKILISGLMIFLISRALDFNELASVISQISYKNAALIVVLYGLGQVLSSVKWWLLADAADIKRPWLLTLRSYFIGMFANCFGLGVLGGDFTRAILLANGKGQRTGALASVVADRATGLGVLALIAITSLLMFGSKSLGTEWVYMLIGLEFIILICWFAGPHILLKLIPEGSRLRKKAEEVSLCFPKNKSTLFLIFIISACFHFLQILMHYIMGLGLDLQLPLRDLLVTIPFVSIMSTLPISWNGLGVREAGYIFFLTPALLNKEQAVAFGAIWLVAVTINSAIGGILALIGGDFKIVSKANEETTNEETTNEETKTSNQGVQVL